MTLSRRIALSGLGFALFVLATAAAPIPLRAEEEPAPPPAERAPAGKPPNPGTRVGQGIGREQMWPAPTAADWAKPVLIPFQRTWEDAVAVAEETGQPILICINMDGEIASEHWAGIRYRQPESAALYEPYVCVIASVYRHNPRDHDDEGRRILCPRFGSVTCGEHIGIEPVIYEKYCDGKRIAPRHIAVDLQKEEVYDVYYINDTAGVFDAIRDGIDGLPAPKPPIIRGDRPIVERVASRHIADRQAVEAAYRQGDAALRRRLLAAAREHMDKAPLELLRLAVFGFDTDMSRLAREALVRAEDPQATPLISDALQVPMDANERDRLIDALQRLGEDSVLARWLAGVHRGLTVRSSTVDPSAWAAGGTYPAPTPSADTLNTEAAALAREAAERPEDPEPRLALAEARLQLAGEAPQAHPKNARLGRRLAEQLYADARETALEAERLGATGWRVNSALALAAYYLGDVEQAYTRADAAMADLPAGDNTWTSMAVVTIHAESRWKAIKKAVKAKEDWPAEWLADLHAAYVVLMRHPLGTDAQVIWHHEFLVWLGADHRARRFLEEGLEHFPDSPALHRRLREHLLEKRGAEALETAYGERMEARPESAGAAFYAGRASVSAAAHHRRTRAWDAAIAAYGRAVERFEAAARRDPAVGAAVDHAVALARAGRARVMWQLDRDDEALDDVLASLRRRPASAGTRDEMGITPGETAQMLLARLRERERTEAVARLETALEAIDPELLQYDR